MFLYKENGTTEDSKLKMATLWDFDSAFASDLDWSRQHYSYLFFYLSLFQDKNFVRTYLDLYKEKIAAVYPYVENSLKEFKNSLDEQIDDVLTHLKERLAKLQTLTAELEHTTAIEGCVDNSDNRIVNRTSILGVDFTGVDVNRLPVGRLVP